MASDANTLYEFAQELLVVAETAVATTAGGITDVRSFVAPSLPALDCCPQLTVHVQAIDMDNTSPGSPPTVLGNRVKLHSVNLVTFVITMVRCSPQPLTGVALPSITDLETAAQQTSQDGWAIWQAVKTAVRAGTLWEGNCLAIYVDPAVPVPDNGGCAGWTITVRGAVQGYEVP